MNSPKTSKYVMLMIISVVFLSHCFQVIRDLELLPQILGISTAIALASAYTARLSRYGLVERVFATLRWFGHVRQSV